MNNSVTNNTLKFYLEQSAYTDFGVYLPMLRNLPNDIGEICKIARNVIEHYHGVNAHKIRRIRLLDLDIRANQAILARIQRQGYDDITKEIAFNDRVIGTCRTQSVLTCGLLRSKGIPARVRYKYCTYFIQDFNHEQVLVEYWCSKKGKWLLVDPAMNYPVLEEKGIHINFDLYDVPHDKAMSIAEAWQVCRKNLVNPSMFGAFSKNSKYTGIAHIRRKLYQDLACLNKIEVVEWDRWGIFLESDQFSEDEALYCDYLANLMNNVLQDEALYKNIAWLNNNIIPVEGVSVSPVNPNYKVIYSKLEEYKMRVKLESIVRSLYQDIFDTGNCPAVDPHYHSDVVCYFNGIELTLNNLKASMAKFVSLHEDIKTEIKDLLVDGERTFARLERHVTCKVTKKRRTINLMVLKEFKDEKIIKLWFMVDDDVYKTIWSEKNLSEVECLS